MRQEHDSEPGRRSLSDIFTKLGLISALARNTAWTLLGAGLMLLIQALYFIANARTLRANKYGASIGVLALVGIAVPFADLGAGNLVVKNVSRDQSRFRLGASWMQDAGPEWLFRLASEPKRRWRRYVYLNSLYVFLTAIQALGISQISTDGKRPVSEVLHS
jgi:Polysaccharide biosynthesis protein